MFKLIIDNSKENSDWIKTVRKRRESKRDKKDSLSKMTVDAVASLDLYLEKQLEACQPGYHAHPGRKCHKVEERHKGKAVEAMEGEQAYWTLHPFAKPKKKAKKHREGVRAEPKGKPKAKTLTEKWFDNAKSDPLLDLKFDSVEDRKKGLLSRLNPAWHDTVEFNEKALSESDPQKFADTNDWLYKYDTTNPKTGKVNGHIVYSKRYHDASDVKKWAFLKTTTDQINRLREHVDALLSDRNPMVRAIGAAINLMDVTGYRIGGEEYAEENGTFGITTLEKGHVKILANNRIELNFVGKAGVAVSRQRFRVAPKTHTQLEILVKGRKNRPLLPISDGDVRKALQPFGIRPKDLRTYKVNMLLVQALNSGPQYKGDRKKRESHIKEVVKSVAGQIGHKPDVSRQKYMHPQLLRAYLDGHAYPSVAEIFKQQEEEAEAPDEVSYDSWGSAEERRFKEYLDTVHIV